MRNEIRVFFTALMFYTRIPCPKWVDHSEEYLNQASRYFPMIGLICGAFSGLIYWITSFFFPPAISVIAAMLTGVLLTGAFHEDGFADVCDGFGGGWTKEKILEIMKDSRVGAYGVIGLFFLLLLKYEILLAISPENLPIIFIVSGALSRFVAITFVFTHTYARSDESSKSKPVAAKISDANLVLAGAFGILPLLLLKNPLYFLILFPLIIFKYLLGRYFQKWIGGFTGDCLGATQQLAEIICYLTFYLLWKYI
jgi:adenosylcobinamide-GDP ribazoletransferase